VIKRKQGETNRQFEARIEGYLHMATAACLIVAIMLLYSLAVPTPAPTLQYERDMNGALRHSAQEIAKGGE